MEIPTTIRTTCRVCYFNQLSPLFSIGEQFVNNFVNKEDAGKGIKAPLELVMCENCSLVQLKHTAPQELLYSGYYWYKSNVTETMRKALREITQKAEEKFNLQAGDVVLDIGSNDGTLLRTYAVPGLITVGVEPAKNLAEEGATGITQFISDFWNYENYLQKVGKRAKVITAIGMFYDMEDPNQFIADIEKALTKDGVFIAQLMCLKNMLDSNDVSNLCHEHLEYYSFSSLEFLFNKHGLKIFDVEINAVNGGSYRVYAKKNGAPVVAPEGAEERIRGVREDEKELQSKDVFLDFFNRIEENKKKCVDFIKREVAKGKKVWVYGASTKGNVILQYYGLDHSLIEAASERSPWKWGKYTVGTMIPCVSEEEARRRQPDYFLVLPYAFFNEMYEREEEWRNKGGKFLVPLPLFRVVGQDGPESIVTEEDTGLENTKEREGCFECGCEKENGNTRCRGDEDCRENFSYGNTKKKKALIFGCTGMDGSYLAEILLEKGYEVHGLIRKSATGNTTNINHLIKDGEEKIILHKGDLADSTSLYRAINEIQPDEIYNEADQDHVGWSFASVGYSCDITGAAVGRILEIIKQINPKIKYFQPVSSNMFGIPAETPQTENTALRPQSPYAAAKVFAYVMCKYYREVFGMFVCTGILYNHESPRRTEDYVTRKITKAAARIKKGLQTELWLGNLDTKIDFGYAREYMEAAWQIMQQEKADDYIVCTGEQHSVREWLEEAFSVVGLDADDYVKFDSRFARPGNTGDLVGNNSKLKSIGFELKVKFKELVKLMVEHDLKSTED